MSKAEEIVDYVMRMCGVQQTEGTPISEVVEQVEFLINTD